MLSPYDCSKWLSMFVPFQLLNILITFTKTFKRTSHDPLKFPTISINNLADTQICKVKATHNLGSRKNMITGLQKHADFKIRFCIMQNNNI
jgi:hypothetical protein